jgi:general secretion pathway protein A
MYYEFYNLKENPFNLTPSSRSFYPGDIHKEALALLNYGVLDRKGLILLTGEVGTGKTTVVHVLLTGLGKDIQYVYLSNPSFSPNEFMNYLALSAFKEKRNFYNKTDFLIQFQTFLEKQLKEKKNFILIIDEAQKLSFELLEEIRLLSNIETSEEKLINIFLVGRPELYETLKQPRLRSLLQRINMRYHIKALDEGASIDYISTRLKMAGAEKPETVIPRNAARTIFKYSGGYPGRINILADNALILGYSKGVRNITPAMVKECYDNL